ncbi:site-specific integrase [Vibrio breoganii]
MAKNKDPLKVAKKQTANVMKKLNVRSLGTQRNYARSLILFTQHLNLEKSTSLRNATQSQALQFLTDRAASVGQKQLDMDRQAIQALLQHNGELEASQTLEVIKTEKDEILQSRAYTRNQVELIQESQSDKHSLATRLAETAGLRAHEMGTLLPIEERAPDFREEHSPFRFREQEKWIAYTVVGKGGLCREVRFPQALADELEERRLETPLWQTDRDIPYKTRYDIGFGKQWSDSFSKASNRALGWSNGGHGLRHTYAQQRIDVLMHHCPYKEALKAASQELGHLRPEITLVYLR